MDRKLSQAAPLLDYAVAASPLRGELVSGDRHIVQSFSGGVLVGVADGLGHGPEAARAADIAIACLRSAPQQHLMTLVRRCHEALKGTRGTVLSLAVFSAADSTLTWLGVGNVEARLLRAATAAAPPLETMVQCAGVVGYQLPSLRVSVVSILPRDVALFATDGIFPWFGEKVSAHEPLQPLADRLLEQYAKGTDDALLLATRWRGVQRDD